MHFSGQYFPTKVCMQFRKEFHIERKSYWKDTFYLKNNVKPSQRMMEMAVTRPEEDSSFSEKKKKNPNHDL